MHGLVPVVKRNRKIGSVKIELLTKSREAMLAAVQIFNNPNIQFKSESFIVLSIIFIVSIVGLFTLTKLTRNIFVTIAILLHCLLIVFCLVQPFLLKAMVLVAFLIIFVNYFLKASTRKLFNDQNSF